MSVTLVSYNAKVCEPQWFCDKTTLDTDDVLEKQKVLKFRGDLAVRQGDFQKAFEAYSACLEWISDNNLTIRRDVLEGMSRCCIKLGQKDKALDLAELLNKEATNTCHLTSLLLLKVSIYQDFGDIRAKISCLQHLCSLLPFNPWHWLDLGQTCLRLLRRDKSTDCCESAEVENNYYNNEEAANFNEERIWLKACTCFIRSRLLLKILQQQQSSFVLKRSEKALAETDEALEQLNLTETTLQSLTGIMSEDLIPEKMREDCQDGESLASVCVQSFRERWWDRVLEADILKSKANGQLKQMDTKS